MTTLISSCGSSSGKDSYWCESNPSIPAFSKNCKPENITSSIESSPSASSPPSVEEVPGIFRPELIMPGIRDKNDFYLVLSDFVSAGCKRNQKNEWPNDLPQSASKASSYVLYLKKYPETFSWGSTLEKIKVVLAGYESTLSYVQDNYKFLNEMKPFRLDDMRSGIRIWSKYSKDLSSKVCTLESLPESESTELLQQLLFDYDAFYDWALFWNTAYQDYVDGELEAQKPQCKEYPSSNPKYTVVKCTNLP